MEPNLGTAKVPDPRLQVLAGIYRPRKVTPAEILYVDVNGLGGDGRQRGLPPSCWARSPPPTRCCW
jgi:ribosome-binding ATPase YchF (GTP1/OBG family)